MNRICAKCGQHCNIVLVGKHHYDQLQAELEQHRWIPVEERLPDKEGQVWFSYEGTGYTYGGRYDPQYKLWQMFDPCGGWSDVDSKSPPTHWKPIILP